MLSAEDALPVASECVKKAWDFWDLTSSWDIKLAFYEDEDDAKSGECGLDLDYLRCHININLVRIADEAELWQVVAHEMAHVALSEFNLFHKVVHTNVVTDIIWKHACERSSVMLERVFLRERPYQADTASS